MKVIKKLPVKSTNQEQQSFVRNYKINT